MNPDPPVAWDQQQPKLLDQVRSAIRAGHYRIRTEEAYVQWIKRFILFHNKRHPRKMGTPEIKAFLSHIAAVSNVAASPLYRALCAILFLYKEVLGQDPGRLEGVVRANIGADIENARIPPEKNIVFSCGATDGLRRKPDELKAERLKWSVGPLCSVNKAGGNVAARKSDVHSRQRIPNPRSAVMLT